MKLQVAMEYLFIVGIVLMFLIPVWVHTTTTQNQASEDLSISYAQAALDKLAATADLVYSQGPPAKVTQNVFVPPSTKSFYTNGKVIILFVSTSSGNSDVWKITKANLVSELPQDEGYYLFTVESINESYVSITYAR